MKDAGGAGLSRMNALQGRCGSGGGCHASPPRRPRARLAVPAGAHLGLERQGPPAEERPSDHGRRRDGAEVAGVRGDHGAQVVEGPRHVRGPRYPGGAGP